MNSNPVLFVGDPRHREFSRACWWLRSQTDLTISDAERALELDVVPTTIVLGQSYPGQISLAQVEALQQRWPSTRMVGLLGTWCEGEMRTGTPWPGVMRFFWHQWSARLPQVVLPCESELRGYLRPFAPEEQNLHRPVTTIGNGASVAIIADSFIAYESVADTCKDAGYVTMWLRDDLRRAVHADAVIWNVVETPSTDFAQLREIRTRYCAQPVIALLGFPRREDVSQALDAGADCVVSKPLLADDLICPLADLLLLTQAQKAA